MSKTFNTVMNMEGDLAYYIMLISNYNFNLAQIRNLLIELETCPTSEIMTEVCNEITEVKEDNQILIEQLKNISSQLINNMTSLNEMLEDYA